jgi:hypothetical protein
MRCASAGGNSRGAKVWLRCRASDADTSAGAGVVILGLSSVERRTVDGAALARRCNRRTGAGTREIRHMSR